MTDSEKWAWWTLGIIALTIVAWGTFMAVMRNAAAASSAFALLALTAVPAMKNKRIRIRDERESAISNRALLAGMRAVWVSFIALFVTTGFVKGWDATLSVPMWMFSSAIIWASMLLLAVESIVTLVLYRGAHA